MPRNSAIAALLALHRVDSEIDKLNSQKELLPTSLRRIQVRLKRHRQSLEEKREHIKELLTKSHSQELLLRAAEEELEKLTRQRDRATSNREYATFQHQIATKKADSSRIEDQVLATMAHIEDLEREVGELEKSIVQVEREHGQETQSISREVTLLEKRVEELHSIRKTAASEVSPELLEEYERIAAKKGATALAAAVGNTCQGCFMQLPPQLGHMLRAGRQIVRCPVCSRLLYLPEHAGSTGG